MKIVILGAQGRLGQELTFALQEEHQVIPLARFNLDITNMLRVQEVLRPLSVDCIINCAAITELGHNPKSEELAFQVNTIGAANVAQFAQQQGIKLIHLSCASVLAGSADKSVKSRRKAIEVIGQSKLEAEETIEKIYTKGNKNYRILRAGTLFGAYGFSLVSNIQRLVAKSSQITAVSDVFYSFTSTQVLAEYIKIMLNEPFAGEILHCCHPGKMSVADLATFFAEKIGKKLEIKAIPATQTEEMAGDFSLVSSQDFGSISTFL